MQGDPPVRFDEGDVETEPWLGYSGTARRKGRQQIDPTYRHRATSLLYKGKAKERLTGSRRSATVAGRSPTGSGLYLGLFGHLECIINFDPEVTHGAFELRMTKQQLHYAQVLRKPVDQCRLGTPHRVCAIGRVV